MKRIIYCLSLAVALSGCGAMKKTQRTDKTDTRTHIDSVGVIVEASRTTIDTTVTLPVDTATGAKPIAAVIAGDSLVIESNGQSVVVKYDDKTKNLKASGVVKPRVVPVQAVKEETRITTTSIQKQAERKTELTDYNKEREGSGFAWGFYSGVFLLVLILAIIIGMRIKRFFIL